jgi:hypothetical protein
VFVGIAICAAMNILDRGIGLGWLALLASVVTLQMWGGNVALDLLDAYSGRSSICAFTRNNENYKSVRNIVLGWTLIALCPLCHVMLHAFCGQAEVCASATGITHLFPLSVAHTQACV